MQASARLSHQLDDLGPHAARLLAELLAAVDARQHATVIILAAAVLDVVLREPAGPAGYADGIDLAAARDNAESYWLRERRNGIVHYEGGRGGEWTWHGPGQRVAYLMLDVAARGQDVRLFIRQVEDWIILALKTLAIASDRRAGYPGVWIHRGDGMPPAKIAAIGVRLSKWVSWHGVAINVNPDLSVYDGIVPCGITDGSVTSLHAEGREDLTMEDLDQALAECFATAFPIP